MILNGVPASRLFFSQINRVVPWIFIFGAPRDNGVDVLLGPGGEPAPASVRPLPAVGIAGGHTRFVRTEAGFQDAAEALARNEHPIGRGRVAEARQRRGGWIEALH